MRENPEKFMHQPQDLFEHWRQRICNQKWNKDVMVKRLRAKFKKQIDMIFESIESELDEMFKVFSTDYFDKISAYGNAARDCEKSAFKKSGIHSNESDQESEMTNQESEVADQEAEIAGQESEMADQDSQKNKLQKEKIITKKLESPTIENVKKKKRKQMKKNIETLNITEIGMDLSR